MAKKYLQLDRDLVAVAPRLLMALEDAARVQAGRGEGFPNGQRFIQQPATFFSLLGDFQPTISKKQRQGDRVVQGEEPALHGRRRHGDVTQTKGHSLYQLEVYPKELQKIFKIKYVEKQRS